MIELQFLLLQANVKTYVRAADDTVLPPSTTSCFKEAERDFAKFLQKDLEERVESSLSCGSFEQEETGKTGKCDKKDSEGASSDVSVFDITTAQWFQNVERKESRQETEEDAARRIHSAVLQQSAALSRISHK